MQQSIQGLRGIVIISVALFHLWPNYFPNGYIGVDIFFVISGYLMAHIFSKYQSVSLQNVVTFYYRRMKRIIPLYYLLTAINFILSQFLLKQAWIPLNNRHFLYSFLFLKNFETIWDKEDYFAAFKSSAPSKDLYLHTWSLAVEVQFYLLAPVIFVVASKIQERSHRLAFVTILGLFSYYVFVTGDPTVSFNSMPCRIWQFVTGIAVFMLKRNNDLIGFDEENRASKSSSNNSVLVLLLLLAFAPNNINPVMFRPFLTLISAILLVCEGGISRKILENEFLVYIGDASYVIYLLHWPVIVLFKGNGANFCLVLGVIMVSSVLVHESYEKKYGKLSTKAIFVLLFSLLLLNAISYATVTSCPAVRKWLEQRGLEELNDLRKTAVEKNLVMASIQVQDSVKCQYNRTTEFSSFQPPWGVCDYPKGQGSLKVLVVGNSYAMNQANVIHEEFGGNYSEFRLISNFWLQVLYDEWAKSSGKYYGQQERVLKMIEKFEPDVVFITTKFQEKQKRPLNPENDKLLSEYVRVIRRIENSTKLKIFIQGPHPAYPWMHLNNLIEAISNNEDLEKFHLERSKTDYEIKNAMERLQAMNCLKCEIYEVSSNFLEWDKYLGFDPETLVSFVDNDVHFTSYGLERIRPKIRKMIQSI